MNGAPATRYACPVCGTVHEHQSERYRNHVCHECAKRARCSHDRGVIGYNTSPMGGGFAAWHADRGDNQCDQVTADGIVTIDGTPYRMREAYMGGIVTTPLPGSLVPVEQTVIWSRDGHIEWTSAGHPAPFVGFIGELAGKRHLLRPSEASRWEWMVRKTGPGVTEPHVVERGIVDTPEQAKEHAIAVLDRMNLLLAEQREQSDRRGRDLDDQPD